ncbi:hypothetical protein HID58_070796, partial [Brassica napus]
SKSKNEDGERERERDREREREIEREREHAYRRAMKTFVKWIRERFSSNKTEVFFVHFLTLLLEENNYFEDAFKVYERGVKTFKYPHVKDIWVRQSWSVPEFVRLEEDYGLAKRAMNVYEKTKEIWRGKRRAEETRFHRRLNGSSCPQHLPQLYQKMVECNSGL